jgi:DNA-binding transcriptional LysR family regulator
MLRGHLNDIFIFMAVVDAGSFVAGGRSVGMSRSAAAKAVMRLEDRIGARLLNRTTRTLSVTDEGRVFYERGLQVLASVEEAEASMAGNGGTPRGVLRLTVPDAFGRVVVLPVIEKYVAAWPELQVEVSFTDRLTDLVEEGFDLAIRIGMTMPDTRLVSRVVANYGAILCASPAYLSQHGEPQTIDELAAHDGLIFSSRNQRQSWRLRTEGGPWIKAPVRSRLRFDSAEALRHCALAGLGIALLPDFLISEDLGAGRLRKILPSFKADEVKIVTLYPNKRLLEARVRRFIDLVVEQLGS